MKEIAALVYRDCLQRITNIAFVIWDVFVPLAYLLLFGTGFDNIIGQDFTAGGMTFSYTAFLLPGVIAMTAFSVAMNTSWSFFMDKDSGIFYELLTYPVTRRQFLVGKICFNALLSMIGAVFTIMLGILAMDIPVRIQFLPLAAFAVVMTTSGWFFLLSVFAIRLRRMDSFNTVTSVAYILLMFMSTMFYPIERLPSWFQGAALFNPMTWQVDVLRFSLFGAGDPGMILLEGAAFCVFMLVCLAFAVRALNQAS